MFVRIVFVSITSMFEYKFVMSNEAKMKCSSNGASLRFWIRLLVFFTIKALGNGTMWLILLVNSLYSL